MKLVTVFFHLNKKLHITESWHRIYLSVDFTIAKRMVLHLSNHRVGTCQALLSAFVSVVRTYIMYIFCSLFMLIGEWLLNG